MGREKFELYFISRKLESANTLHRLEKVWKEIEEKKLTPDAYTENVYNKKRKELKEKGKGQQIKKTCVDYGYSEVTILQIF